MTAARVRRSALRRGVPVAGLAGAVVLLAPALSGVACISAPLQAQSWASVQYERQAVALEELRVEVTYGAGTFRLGPAGGGHLYRARIRYDEDAFSPTHELVGNQLRIGVQGTSSSGRRVSLRGDMDEAELDLQLGRRVPTRLELSLGAVRADLDLGGIPLRALELSTGASDTSIRVSSPNPESLGSATFKVGAAAFAAQDLGNLRAREIRVEAGVGEVKLGFGGLSTPETTVRASVGLGALELTVPRNVGIHLTRSGFLSSMNAPGLERNGNTWMSSNWDSASVRLRVVVESALGSVAVVRTP
jgi:hypothetical protein